jgi:hypothetical protein
MATFEDLNGVIWNVQIVNQTWVAAPSKDSQRTYTNPGANIAQQTQTVNGVPVVVDWATEGEPGLFARLPAAQPDATIQAWARQVTSNPTAKAQILTLRVTASPDNGGALLLLLLLAFVLLGKDERR